MIALFSAKAEAGGNLAQLLFIPVSTGETTVTVYIDGHEDCSVEINVSTFVYKEPSYNEPYLVYSTQSERFYGTSHKSWQKISLLCPANVPQFFKKAYLAIFFCSPSIYADFSIEYS